jgi:nucleolar GTP-binding protein
MDIADYDGARHDYIQEYIDKTEDPLLISALEGEGVEEIVRLITRVKKIDRILDVEVEEEDDEHYFDLT